MISRVLLLTSASLLVGAASAEPVPTTKKIVCDDASIMLPWFDSEHGEKPVWIGDIKENVRAALVLNPETRTWSFVIYNMETACLIEDGQGFKEIANSVKGTL